MACLILVRRLAVDKGMSAIGPKRTSVAALHESAFGGKADMALCGMSAFAVAIGCKADIA
jgi:hypothetical protein